MSFLALAQRLEAVREDLSREAALVASAWTVYQNQRQAVALDSTALRLQSWYTAFETMLEVIAQRVDDELPQGSAWHRELIDQMAREIPGLRPRVLVTVDLRALSLIRGFRHLVRNAYAVEFDPQRVATLVEDLMRLDRQVAVDFSSFATFLRGAHG
jgi:hypothetical protein